VERGGRGGVDNGSGGGGGGAGGGGGGGASASASASASAARAQRRKAATAAAAMVTTVLPRRSCRWNASDWRALGRRGDRHDGALDGHSCDLDFSALGAPLVLGAATQHSDGHGGGAGGAAMLGLLDDPVSAAASEPEVEPPSVKLLIGIISGCCGGDYYERRAAMRSTWGQQVRAALPGVRTDIAYRFVVGRPAGSAVEARATTAHMPDADYADVLHVPVEDGYRNVMLKLLHLADWAVTNVNFLFLLKADDDTLFSVASLRRSVARWESGSADGRVPPRMARLYHGHLWTGPPIRRRAPGDPFFGTAEARARDADAARGGGGAVPREHKNALPAARFPLPVMPPYAHGAAYVVSRDIALYIAQNEAALLPGLLSGDDNDACGFGNTCGGGGGGGAGQAGPWGPARPRAGNVEDIQMGLWAFSLGVQAQHDHRFSDHIHCHSSTIALFDLPPNLMHEVIVARLAGSHRIG
jgi:hypothetical protein